MADPFPATIEPDLDRKIQGRSPFDVVTGRTSHAAAAGL